MTIAKPAIVAFAAVGLFSAALPAWSQLGSGSKAIEAPSPYYGAVMLPTPQQVQLDLTVIGNQIKSAKQSSFYSPTAESDYLAAQRDFAFGDYDRAADEAQAAAASLPDIPNWKSVKLVSRDN